MARRGKNLKTIVEQGIKDVLESKEEPSDGRLKALALGIKMCALNAKLEESEYGDFFDDEPGTASGGAAKGTKRAARVRANGSGDPLGDTDAA